MAKVYATPGVYIEEKSAFPNSVVSVPTAVPAFIGYTQQAMRGSSSLTLVPTRISSYGEYLSLFGGPPHIKYSIADNSEDKTTTLDYRLEVDRTSRFLLEYSMRLFFSNGGSDCYIVSVGTYEEAKTGVVKADLEKGFAPLSKESEPTMVVIPDAVMIEGIADYYDLMQMSLGHCGTKMRDRVAILDVFDGYKDLSPNEENKSAIELFREGIGSRDLQWGATYYPWVETTIVSAKELDFTNISNIGSEDDIMEVSEDEATNKVSVELQKVTSFISLLDLDLNRAILEGVITVTKAKTFKEEFSKLVTVTPADKDAVSTLNETLTAISPMYKAVMHDLRRAVNTLPPSGAMAGIYSMVDNNVGVWQSPANVSVGSVIKPIVNITNEQQEDLNLPLSGKAVNAIRSFPGKGTLVWGARTLDGNSLDWRYISVRRTVIFIEQSIKSAAEAYVFAPNTSTTWINVKAMITNFLTNVWQAGGLAGAVAEDAFSVDVGLGVTMTPVDILDGIMRVTVKVAVTRPAEFIVITFEQQMQKF